MKKNKKKHSIKLCLLKMGQKGKTSYFSRKNGSGDFLQRSTRKIPGLKFTKPYYHITILNVKTS